MRRLAAIGLFMIACTGVPPQNAGTTPHAGTATAQMLTLSYSKDAIYKYRFVLMSDFTVQTVALTDQERIDLSAKEALTVSSVDARGVAEVMVTFTDANLKTTLESGQATAVISNGPSTLTETHFWLAPDGRALNSYDGGTLPDDPVMFGVAADSRFVSAVLSDSAVKPGDTWTKNYDVPSGSGAGSIQVIAKSSYLRNETFRGVQVAVVETISTANVDIGIRGGSDILGTASSDVTSWIDPSAHRIVKTVLTSSSELSMAASPFGSLVPGAGPFSQKGTQTLDLESA
jgi:hypothetical protein